jgi:hypothetical protein
MLTNAYHAYHYFWKVFAVETCGKKERKNRIHDIQRQNTSQQQQTPANTRRILAYASLQHQNISQH